MYRCGVSNIEESIDNIEDGGSYREKIVLEELPNISETGYEKNSGDFTELYSGISGTVST